MAENERQSHDRDPAPDDEDVEEASMESFPASDPPAWTGTTAGAPTPRRDPVDTPRTDDDGSSADIPGGRRFAVIYDGNCRTCVRLTGLLRRWDRKEQLWIVPSSDPAVLRRFPWIDAAAYQRALQMVGPGRETREGTEALAYLLDYLPGGTPFARLFRLPVIGPLLDRGYRWFARNRASFGCGDHCSLRLPPDDGLPPMAQG